jgi:hypothetical protein
MQLQHSHRPELDNMSPAMIRVVAEFLLYTMEIDQRIKFSTELPGIYKILYQTLPTVVRQMNVAQAVKEGL